MLSVLLAAEQGALSPERVIESLWPTGAYPDRAELAVRSYVSRLRRVLGADVIVRTDSGYALLLGKSSYDAAEFERLVTADLPANGAVVELDRLRALDSALGLWRGRAFEEFSEEWWARPVAARLEERRLACIEDRFDVLLDLRRHQEIVSDLLFGVAEQPLRARTIRQAMVALHRCDRQAEALRVFQVHRQALAEAGLEPTQALAELERSIVAGRSTHLSGPVPDGGAGVALPPALARSAGELPLGGRNEEISELLRFWKDTHQGRANVVFVGGEPGSGKSRLLAEFARVAHERGSVVAFGRCDEDLPTSCAPFAHVVRYLVARTRGREDHLAVTGGMLARLVGGLGAPGEPLPSTGDPESDRYALFEAIGGFLSSIATREAPLVLIFDDVHWADPDTLALLRSLTLTTMAAPITIACSYRDTDVTRDHPFSRLLADLRSAPAVTRLTLAPLDVEAVTDIVERCGLDPAIALDLHSRSGGNPFFLRELIAAMGDSENDPVRVLPDGVREVVTRRVDRLGTLAHDTLEAASVIGAEFATAILLELIGSYERTSATETEVLRLLESAVRAHLVVESGLDRWRFAHALVRDTLSMGLSLSRRARLHHLIADATRKHQAHELAAIAYHLDRSGPELREEALQQLCLWGDTAAASFAAADACAAYERAVQIADDLDHANPERRAELRVPLARAMAAAGNPRWRKVSLEAGALAAAAGRTDLMVRAALVVGRTSADSGFHKVDEERIAAAQTALASVELDAVADRALLTARLSDLLYADSVREAVPLARQAIGLARHSGDDVVLGKVLAWTAIALQSPHELYDAHQRTGELLAIGRSLDNAELICGGAYHHAAECARIGDLDGIDRCIAALEANYGKYAVAKWSRHHIGSYRRLMVGDFAGAENEAEAGLHEGLRVGQTDAPVLWGYQISHIDAALGRPPSNPDAAPAVDTVARAVTSLRLLQRGEFADSAALVIAENADEFGSVPQNHLWVETMVVWCMPVFYLRLLGFDASGLREAALTLERVLLPHHNRFAASNISVTAPVDVALGQAAFAADLLDLAAYHFQSAAALCERTGFTYHGASAKTALALTLLRREGPHYVDRTRVEQLLSEAELWATEHGAANIKGLIGLAQHLDASSQD